MIYKNESYQNNIKISIVIPAYNNEAGIIRCLDSVINQTYKNIEIIIVYLKSFDKTLEIIQSYNDERIKIIEQKEKTGPGGARNIGVDNATGEYIGFIEADDCIPLDYYEILYYDIIKNSSDISICKTNRIAKNGSTTCITNLVNSACDTIEEKISSLCCGASFNKLFKKNILDLNNIPFICFLGIINSHNYFLKMRMIPINNPICKLIP